MLGFQTNGEIPIYGTMAHSYILSYTDASDLGKLRKIKDVDIIDRAVHYRNELNVNSFVWNLLINIHSGLIRITLNYLLIWIMQVAILKSS